MNVLPMELWIQVFQYMWPEDCLKLMTTCRLFHSLLEAKLYEDIQIRRGLTKEHNPSAKESRSMKFLQTLTARPSLFSLVRKLHLHPSDMDTLLDPDVSKDNPVLRQLPHFPLLRHLILESIYIDADCYTAIRSIPRLEYLEILYCAIDAALLEIQPFQGNAISTLCIHQPSCRDGWAALMTPGIHTFIIENFIGDARMDNVLRSLLSCDLRRTLTKLEWKRTKAFDKEFCRFIEPCVQLESLKITYWFYPQDDAVERFSHFEELSSGSLPMLSKFRGSAEHTAAIMAGRSVHSVSLQLWNDTPKDVLLALQLSKVPITQLELLQEGSEDYEDYEDIDDVPAYTGPYLDHLPKTIEILSLHETLDKEKLQSWIPALSKLSRLQTMECAILDSGTFNQIEAVRLISEACPSIRKIFFNVYGFCYPKNEGKWVLRNDGSWEHYPATYSGSCCHI